MQLGLNLKFNHLIQIRGPTNGTCLTDRFIITGHNTNDILPDICGINTGQHGK